MNSKDSPLKGQRLKREGRRNRPSSPKEVLADFKARRRKPSVGPEQLSLPLDSNPTQPPKPRKKDRYRFKKELLVAQGGRCMYCGRRLPIDLMDIDHKLPVSRGGSDDETNLQVLCRTCNGRKNDLTDQEFRQVYKDAGVPRASRPPAKAIRRDVFERIGKGPTANAEHPFTPRQILSFNRWIERASRKRK